VKDSPLDPVLRTVASLPKHLVVLIPSAMTLGVAVGLAWDMAPLKSLVLPLTILMVYPMLVNFRLSEAFSLRDKRALGIAMALNFLVLPFLAWALARTFFAQQPGLFVGLLLVGLIPTSGMTISWTGFAKGNVAAAVKMTVIGLLAASLLVPVYLLVFAGAVVDVNVLEIMRTVLVVVLVPMAAGVLTRAVLVKRYGRPAYKRRIAPVFPGLSTIGVMAIVFLAIGLKAPMIVREPAMLARVAAPLVIFYATAFAFTTLVSRVALPRGDALAAVFGSVMRNLSVALGIAVASFGPDAALVLAVAYVVQVQGAAWYVRLADRLFGPAVEELEPAAATA